MTNEQLNSLAEDVRTEGYNPSASMKDLVYDPVSGEFKQIRKGAPTGNGEVVTEMTNKGFAAEEGTPIAYLREDELQQADESLSQHKHIPAFVEEVDEDGVYHVHLHPQVSKIPMFLELPGFFTKDPELMSSSEMRAFRFCVLMTDSGPEVWCRLKPFGNRRSDRNWKKAESFLVPSEDNLFSRSKGILEVGILKNKRVLIVGLGSFGSQIAIELAKAGVGSFSLVDFDRVELHNLSRHTATVRDLGRLKTNVIAEAVHGKNPYARVDKFPVNVNEDLPLLYDEVEKADLVICATDNNTSRFNISKALVEKGKVGIFGRAVTRAEGGDVFRYRPGGPCYCCLVGAGNLQEEEISDVASARRDGRIAAYVSPEDAEAMVQVGLSSDIAPICNMMVKLALVELSRGTESGISSLEDELVFDYYMWANRREKHFANWKAMPNAGGMPTIMRWYGARIEKEAGCPICGETIVLDDSKDDGDEDYTGLSL
jgi:molybdopterin/thiamine biosynthesis adenylyltransferase